MWAVQQSRFCFPPGVILVAMLVLVGIGCGRKPKTILLNDATSETGSVSRAGLQKAPFDQAGNTEGISPSESLVAAPHHLPAGTPIIIRLQARISSANAHPGDSFSALLDEPIVVSGHTIAPRGATVTGTVVAARPSGRSHDPGYLRVTLATITVKGKAVAVQSSSIFVKGKSHEQRKWESFGGGPEAGALGGGLAGEGKAPILGGTVGPASGTGFAYGTGSKDVGFGAERRLTFRLIDPVDVKG